MVAKECPLSGQTLEIRSAMFHLQKSILKETGQGQGVVRRGADQVIMGWFGGSNGSSSSPSEAAPSATVVQLEQQIEMMDVVFRQ